MDNVIADNLNVLVFRSTIDTPAKVKQVREALLSDHNIYQVDVDLEDADKVLRVECHPDYSPKQLREHISQVGFECTRLL